MASYADYGIELNSNKTHGEVDCICPKCSHDRKKVNVKCLRVNVDKKTWLCQHCGFTGGLPKDNGYVAPTPKTYKKPVWKNNLDIGDKLVRWFEKERKISQKTLKTLKVTEGITYMPQIEKEINCIQFNYFRDGELVNIKSRDGAKRFKLESGAELIFYNLDSLVNAKEAWIVEGEIETLTLQECGIIREGVAGLSVPNGANLNKNNLQYIDNCIDLFDTIEKIHIATDDDPAGRKLREELADRFGKDRCDYIDYKGKKDLNEVLVAGDIQAVIDCCADKKEFPLEGIFKVSDYINDIEDMYLHGIDNGIRAGMGKFDDHLRFVKGWFSVVGGIPNSGKTAFLDNLLVKLMVNHGWKNAYYSPENKPTKLHFSKLARILIGKNWFGKNRITKPELQTAMEFFEDKVFFVEPERNFTLDTILDSVKLLKKRKGIDCFTLDAWNRIEHKHDGKNETKYVNESLLKLDSFCKLHNLHCFLVAHPVKMEKDKRTGKFLVPNLYSISGSSHFFNVAGNGFTAYRNFDSGTTDIHIQKVKFQPEWGHQGVVTYKYDFDSGRFNESERRDSEGKIDPTFKYTPDTKNWLLANQVQATMEIPEATNDIIVNKNINESEMPF